MSIIVHSAIVLATHNPRHLLNGTKEPHFQEVVMVSCVVVVVMGILTSRYLHPLLPWSLFTNKWFMLDERFLLKIAIYFWNMKNLLVLLNFSPNYCLGLCQKRSGHSLKKWMKNEKNLWISFSKILYVHAFWSILQ